MKTYFLFSAQYLPHMGGVERYTSYLAKGLLAEGNRVLVITSNPGGLPDHEKLDGVPVLRLPAVPLVDGRFPVPRPCGKFLRLHRKLKALRPDVVLVNTRFYFHSLYGILYGRARHARTILLDHGSGHLHMPDPLLDPPARWFEHGITALEKCFCREFYGVSRASAAWLGHFHIQARGILPNAVDLREIDGRLRHPRTDFRQAYGIPPEDTVIIYTGRLIPEKGVPALRDAFLSLAGERSDIWLLLAGDGPLEEALRSRPHPRMRLTGRLSPEDVTDLLRAGDIFCLPSVSEGFSTSILEAAACKDYVIVTESACPRELFPDASFACVLPDGKPDTIRRALSEAADHPDRREAAASRARKRLEEHFTWEAVLRQLHRFLDEPAGE